MDYTPLYIGTIAMIILAITIILITLYSAHQIKGFKEFANSRDEHYMNRIDGIEAIMRTEFKAMVETLKNL